VADQAVLEIAGLSKRYGARDALRDVDMVVRPGEIHGLLGRNGAGKTTLLRMALGLARPSAGSARLFGAPARSAAEGLPGRIAGFADTPRFYPYLSGRRNLELLGRMDDPGAAPEPRTRVADLLRRVGLTAEADLRVGSYSTGMRQRLGLAAALLRSPRLLLLDEPSSGLDPAGACDLREQVRRLAAEGVAIVLSSHDMAEIEELCGTLTVLHHGRVVFSGLLEELRNRSPAAVHAMRTSDDERACAIAEAETGPQVSVSAGHLEVRADEATLDGYVVSLGREGVAIRSLTGRETRLESSFLTLTADDRGAPWSDPPSRLRTSVGTQHTTVRIAGVRAVVGVELAKLAAQLKVWAALGICMLGPFAFVVAIKVQGNLPEDTLFGRWVRASGFAVPLLLLGFSSSWVLPVLTSVVSGDLFSSEDRYGTWSTLLTRSRTRGEIFAGKVVTGLLFSVVAVSVLALGGILAGTLLVGKQPLLSLSGTVLPPHRAFIGVALAWGSVVPPALAFSALAMLSSIATRSSAAGVGLPVLIAFAMQLYAFVDGPQILLRAMLTTSLGAWHGLLADPPFYGPLLEGTATSAIYLLALTGAGYVLLRRRDMGG
jgi:ABC-type multidrug transport system ATPase subunit/ABC-type transport system involved in multi-copper enzyme maturation permease subunit